MVLKVMPKVPVIKNVIAAFIVGGIICSIGQIILNAFTIKGFTDVQAAAGTSGILVFLGALLTGLGIYDELGKFAGAGSIVPITGFANSITSPALEFKREGYIYGIGAKVFVIAGPVLLYGTLASIIVGLIFFITL
jgi:stage V sporulation protein AC